MNKFLKIASLALLSGTIVFSTTTFAQMKNDSYSEQRGCQKEGQWEKGERHEGKWSKERQRGFGKMKHALRHMDLSDTQQTKIEVIMTEAKPAIKSMYQAMRDSRDNFHTLIKNSEYDEQAVQKAANDQANLMAQKLIFMAKTKADIFTILTPEQQQTLTDKFESRKHH